MALHEHHKRNFAAIVQAARDGNVAVVAVKRKTTCEEAAALCAICHEPDGRSTFVPFAIMVDGNPFEDYELLLPDSITKPATRLDRIAAARRRKAGDGPPSGN